VKEICERLAMSRRTFDAHYRLRFSDRRPADRRRQRTPIVIPEDELVIAIEQGWEALELFRQRHKRT
jgi:hypothetical protein